MALALSQITALGLTDTLYAAGIHFEVDPAGAVHFATSAMESAATSLISGYSGSAAELSWHKARKLAALDAVFDAAFDLAAFIRGGTATGLTSGQVGTFLAQIANNYRTLRAAIAGAATVAVVEAVNIAAGWPSNP